MKSVCIEIGDLEYELEVTHYEPSVSPSGWDPGAGGEVEVADTVKLWDTREGKAFVREKVTLKEFLVVYADYNSLPIDKAEQKLMDEVYEDVTQQYADDFDDREPDDER
jgi:hypothetical protein